jgi:Tfp pilus assembly protein PilX
MRERGMALLLVLVLMTLMVGMAALFVADFGRTRRQLSRARHQLEAFNLAEAGVDKAVWELGRNAGYPGESGTRLGKGTFSVAVRRAGGLTTVVSTGVASPAGVEVARATVQAQLAGVGGAVKVVEWRQTK